MVVLCPHFGHLGLRSLFIVTWPWLIILEKAVCHSGSQSWECIWQVPIWTLFLRSQDLCSICGPTWQSVNSSVGEEVKRNYSLVSISMHILRIFCDQTFLHFCKNLCSARLQSMKFMVASRVPRVPCSAHLDPVDASFCFIPLQLLRSGQHSHNCEEPLWYWLDVKSSDWPPSSPQPRAGGDGC